MVEHALSKQVIKTVLLDIDPLARKLFSNVLEANTGIDPSNACNLDLEQSIHFFKQVWGNCLHWGNQRFNYVEESVREVSLFLKEFSESEIHNFEVFSEKLYGWTATKPITSIETEPVVRTTELLQKFRSVRFKTAALIMRFLCLDSSFFIVDNKKLIPPLDRVNYKMCQQIFGKIDTDGLGKMDASFSKEKTMEFDKLGRKILGDDKVLIDNLWFIGHFYHDGSNCKIREGVKIVDFQYLKNVNPPKKCPFSGHGCSRDKCSACTK